MAQRSSSPLPGTSASMDGGDNDSGDGDSDDDTSEEDNVPNMAALRQIQGHTLDPAGKYHFQRIILLHCNHPLVTNSEDTWSQTF